MKKWDSASRSLFVIYGEHHKQGEWKLEALLFFVDSLP